jgi:hypothetical protein
MRNRLTSLDTAVWTAIGASALIGAALLFWLIGGPSVTIDNHRSDEKIVSATGPLTGLPCTNPTQRPIAVMLASDPEARPLAGLGSADMVFEMPVTPNGITRFMAVFQCREPKEVGSIRSARMDFIPFVEGLDAIYAHWGGEHDALAKLNAGATDNINALLYDGSVYYRKNNIPRPHNGFTTLNDLREKAEELGYTASSSLSPYAHTKESPERNLAALVSEISIPWPQNMGVVFRYDAESNTYRRWRGGTPEIDAETNQQVAVSVVAVLESEAAFQYDQYISVRTTGQGGAEIYQNGRRISATWKKTTAKDMLEFVDSAGKTIPLVSGPIWVIVNPPLP